MKIVIDTNVIASAIFFGGKPRELVQKLMLKEFEAFATKEIAEEYQETVEYLLNKYPNKAISVPLTQIIGACQIIETKSDVKVCRDPDDDKFIECAVDAKCIYIVSGDKDLLSMESYKDIEIVTVAEFLSRL